MTQNQHTPESEEGVWYEHPDFPVGTRVFISPQVREKHPLSRIAGREGTVVGSRYYPEYGETEPDLNLVPVQVPDQEKIWYAERQFVQVL